MAISSGYLLSASDITGLQNRLKALFTKHNASMPTIGSTDARLNYNGQYVNFSHWASGSLNYNIALAISNDPVFSEIPHLLWALMDIAINNISVLSYSNIGTDATSAKNYYNSFVLKNTPISSGIFSTMSSQISKLESVAPCYCYCHCNYSDHDCCGDMGCPGLVCL